MTENPKTSLPSMSGKTGFSLGFFCGAILAGVGVYLATAPEGKKLRGELIKEFEVQKTEFFNKTLTEDQNEEMVALSKSLQHYLHKIKEVINPKTKEVTKTNTGHTTKKTKRYFKSTV